MSGRRLIAVTLMWWAAHFALALPLAAELWHWLRTATEWSPSTDLLATRVNVATIAELLRGEHGSITSLFTGGWAVAAGIAFVMAPLAATGTLAVAMFPAGGVLRTFATGIGRGGWRAVTIGLSSRILALAGAVALALVASATVGVIAGEGSEAGAVFSPVAGIAAGALAWLWLVALSDIALVGTLREPSASIVRVAGRAFVVWARHPLRLASIWIIAGIVPALALQAAYLGAASLIVTSPLLLFCAQQTVMLGRAFLRVQILARECAMVPQHGASAPTGEAAGPDGPACTTAFESGPDAGRSISSADSRPHIGRSFSPGYSLGEIQQIRPGEDREREIHQGKESEHAVQPEQVQAHRAADGEEFRESEPGTDPGVPERVGDQGIAFRDAEGDAQVREGAVEDLRHEKQDDDEISKPRVRRDE
jgi:hypothetical protein